MKLLPHFYKVAGPGSSHTTGATASLALISEGKYGYNGYGRAMHLTVLGSPFYASHTPFVVEEGMPQHRKPDSLTGEG